MVGVVDVRPTAVELEGANVLDLRLRRDGLGLEAGDRGQHLEDRTGLVDGADDRVDEARRVDGGDRAVVVGVVRGVGRLGQDLARVRVHDDGRYALRRVGRPGGQDLALERELEPRIDRQADVLAGQARVLDDDRVRDRPGRDIPLGVNDPRLPAELGLVVLLDAVLADAVPVDEAEEVSGEGRIGPRALVRVDPDRLRLEEHRLDLLGRRSGPDPIGGLPVEAVGQDDVLLVRGHPGLQELRLVVAEPEQRDELCGHLPPPSRAQLGGHRREPLAIDGRGQDDDPAPVVDITAPAG